MSLGIMEMLVMVGMFAVVVSVLGGTVYAIVRLAVRHEQNKSL